jgi:hypothetical protein
MVTLTKVHKVSQANDPPEPVEERKKRWTSRIERILPYASAIVLLFVAFVAVAALVVVSGSDRTVNRIDTSSEVSNCRARFANEREGIRAQLEADSAQLSAALARGLAAVVSEPDNPAAVEEILIELPSRVDAVVEKADQVSEIVEQYDAILDLPDGEFLAACEKRFG